MEKGNTKMNDKEIIIFSMKMDKNLKNNFVKACKNNDSSASQEIRKFIKEYLKKDTKNNI